MSKRNLPVVGFVGTSSTIGLLDVKIKLNGVNRMKQVLPIIHKALVESDKFWGDWPRPDMCIAACRSLQLALREINITLEPVIAQARFLNQPMLSALESGALDTFKTLEEARATMESTGAWGVGLGYVEAWVRAGLEPPPTGKWSSHLVLIEREQSILIDPTIGQASRPEKGITLPQSIAIRVPRVFLEGSVSRELQFDNHCIGSYELFPREGNTWGGSADWREKKRYKPLIKQIQRAIRA